MATDTDRSGQSNPSATGAELPGASEVQKIRRMLGLLDGKPRELPEWKWEPNDDWRAARGMLSDHPEHDTSKMKAAERAWEEEHDARKFGWTHKP
jgi:hypothetical protein